MSRNSFAELPEYNSDQESEKAPEKTTEKPTEKKTRKPKVQWAFVEKFETNELAQEFVKKESIWSFKREYETVDSYNKTYRCNNNKFWHLACFNFLSINKREFFEFNMQLHRFF